MAHLKNLTFEILISTEVYLTTLVHTKPLNCKIQRAAIYTERKFLGLAQDSRPLVTPLTNIRIFCINSVSRGKERGY